MKGRDEKRMSWAVTLTGRNGLGNWGAMRRGGEQTEARRRRCMAGP